jgi:hypothetical protein
MRTLDSTTLDHSCKASLQRAVPFFQAPNTHQDDFWRATLLLSNPYPALKIFSTQRDPLGERASFAQGMTIEITQR